MILEKIAWKEFHPNGQVWITGQIGIIAPMWAHLYDFRKGFRGYEEQFVCRIGLWTKYFDNGQLAWTLDYRDGTHDCKKEKFPSYREDGTIVLY